MASKAIQLALRRQKLLKASIQTKAAVNSEFRLEDFLFKQQLDFVQDPAPFKTAVCSRRAGKTTACAAHLIDTALKQPDIVALYITLSRALAKKIIWAELRRINRTYKLEGKENKSELSITFPNGSTVYLSGAGTLDQVAHFRGLALKTCYIDEAQSFRSHIRELIDDVIGPALMDYDGSLMLIGTPGPLPVGFFYECSVGNPEWSKHKWTFFDNPFISFKSKKTHQQLLERELKRRGVDVEHPSIQREWFGLWREDKDSLLLQYEKTRNDFIELPQQTLPYQFILGIDLGFEDADALAVLAYHSNSPVTYLVEEIVTEKQSIDGLMAQISGLMQKYSFTRMVADTGGLGKKIVETLNQRYSTPIQAADKTQKLTAYALLNDALRRGHFKARPNSRFAQDCNLLQRDKDKSTPEKIVIRGHSDSVDSALYAFRESPAFYYKPPEPKPTPGTPEANRQLEDAIWKHHEEQLKRAQKGSTEWKTDQNGLPPWLKW